MIANSHTGTDSPERGQGVSSDYLNKPPLGSLFLHHFLRPHTKQLSERVSLYNPIAL